MSSQQQQQPGAARTSSSALGGGSERSKQPLRSDSTRPASSRTSGVAGSLGRQASSGSLPGATASAAASATTTTRPVGSRASLGAGRTAPPQPPAGTTTVTSGITAARPLGTQPSAATATDGRATQSNALPYEVSGGSGVLSAARRRDADADLQQQASAAAASLLAAAGGSAAVAAAARPAAPAAAAVSARLSAAAAPPPKPQHFLLTTGDLFVMPDQDTALKVCFVCSRGKRVCVGQRSSRSLPPPTHLHCPRHTGAGAADGWRHAAHQPRVEPGARVADRQLGHAAAAGFHQGGGRLR